MNPATASFHFLIGAHPVDLLRLGLAAAAQQRRGGEAARPLVVVTFGGASVAAACACPVPSGHTGDSILGTPVLTVAHTGTEIEMVLPPAGDGATAEWLDRSRELLAPRGHDLIFVALALSRAGTDLPPLEPGDHLSCFWELGDLHARGLPDEDSAGGFGDVAERLACQSATFDGIHLYSRNEARHERLRPWAENICRDAGERLVGGGNVLVLAEYDLHVTTP